MLLTRRGIGAVQITAPFRRSQVSQALEKTRLVVNGNCVATLLVAHRREVNRSTRSGTQYGKEVQGRTTRTQWSLRKES